MSDELRGLARAGLEPLVENPPVGPEWDELVGTYASSASQEAPAWLVLAGAVVVALGLAGISLLSNPGEPSTPTEPLSTAPTSTRFDPQRAKIEAETWWELVIAGDIEAATAMSHPDASFNFRGLASFVGRGDGVGVEVENEQFGTETLPQLCFAITGGKDLSGSMVFRQEAGEWLIWEVRPNVENCRRAKVDNPDHSPVVTDLPVVTQFDVIDPVPLRVFTVGNGFDSVIDLESGTTIRYQQRSRLTSYAGSVVDSRGHYIVWSYEPWVKVFENGDDQPIMTLGADELSMLPEPQNGIRGVPIPGGDAVWLVRPGREFGAAGTDTIAVQYAIPSGEVLSVIHAGDNAMPVGATSGGVVFNTSQYFDGGDGWETEPGSQRVIYVDLEGNTTDLGRGEAIAVIGDQVAILDCPHERDRDELCYVPAGSLEKSNGLWVTDLEGNRTLVDAPFPGTWMEVGDPPIPSDAMPLATISRDGSRLLIRKGTVVNGGRTPQSSELIVVDLNTGESRGLASYDAETPTATWSTDGRWVVTFTRVFNREFFGWIDVTVINSDDPGNTFTYEGLIPEGQYPMAAG